MSIALQKVSIKASTNINEKEKHASENELNEITVGCCCILRNLCDRSVI